MSGKTYVYSDTTLDLVDSGSAKILYTVPVSEFEDCEVTSMPS